jgi:hypothetical protein
MHDAVKIALDLGGADASDQTFTTVLKSEKNLTVIHEYKSFSTKCLIEYFW